MSMSPGTLGRRQFLKTSACGIAAIAAAPYLTSAGPPAQPFHLGSTPLLFLDYSLTKRKKSGPLPSTPPQRRELVMIADQPWERNGISCYCDVLHDPVAQEFRLYYVPIHLDSDPIFRVALAT